MIDRMNSLHYCVVCVHYEVEVGMILYAGSYSAEAKLYSHRVGSNCEHM